MDTLFVNGRIRTLDPAQPQAEAIAVQGGRIAAVGSTAALLGHFGSATPAGKIVDLAGAHVLPGFTDCHVHFIAGGLALQAVNLQGAADPAEFAGRIASRAATAPPGEWITGGGWDQETWPGTPLPHRDWIDALTPDQPVFVTRLDLHVGLANSAALAVAGITAATPDPCGGEIIRDAATGEPTGLLKDKAMDLIGRCLPQPSDATRSAALRAALALAARNGITSVHDVTDWKQAQLCEWQLYREFCRRGELSCRIFARMPLLFWDERRAELPEFRLGPQADPWLRFGGLKGFVDGSLGGRTAYFFEPYIDAPGYCGLLNDEMFPAGTMERRIREADLAGLPVSVHAIGDRANAILLDIFAQVAAANGPRDRRWRIEHAQHLQPADVHRMAALGVIASVQPAHILDEAGWAEKKIGEQRGRMTYAFRSLADAGVLLAAGSDWPVARLDPLLGIYAAVTRRPLPGAFPDGWQPQQKLSVAQAVAAYTTGAALAEFAEAEKGSLAPGKFADFTVLSDDIFVIDPLAIPEVSVRMTVAGGNIVHGG